MNIYIFGLIGQKVEICRLDIYYEIIYYRTIWDQKMALGCLGEIF